MSLDDEEVRRLDVPMGEPRVPETTDELHPFVDDVVSHLGVSQCLGVLEELLGEEIFLVRRQLNDPV